MEYLGEKVAYLKGLAEGLKVSSETNEGKIIAGILDVLDEMCTTLSDMEDEQFELTELVDELDYDLGELEEEIYELDGEYDDDDDDEFFEVECPNCGEVIYVDECSLFDDGVVCPECDEKIEFDFDDCDCDDCGCGCDCDCKE